MKNILPFIFLFIGYCSSAQNYNCLQPRVKPFFTNGDGYLRGMRIDAVTTSGTDTVFHPYHTPRSALSFLSYAFGLDPAGGSWLGKNVIKHADGTFVFDGVWHDSVVIKTQAHPGDTWTFFADTTHISYKATLTATDTMTILGIVDSVKKISIEADTSGVMNADDPVNNFEIILSQNHGFVQIFDLYTFPYHIPDDVTSGMWGYDYYLDLITHALPCICDEPAPRNYVDSTNSIFRIVPFHNPTLMEVNNFSVGQVMEFTDQSMAYSGSYNSNWITLDTVLSKTYTATSVTYTFAERSMHTVTTYPPPTTTVSGYYGIATRSYDSTLLIDTTLMPEEWHAQYFYHFFPKANYDSGSVCVDTVCIVDVNNISYTSAMVIFEAEAMGVGISVIGNTTKVYSIGLGLSGISMNDYTNSYIGGPANSETGYYMYTNSHGLACGGLGYLPTSVAPLNAPVNRIDIFPNPATTKLTISSPENITSVVITNLLGQTVYSSLYSGGLQASVDVAALAPGVYLVKVNGAVVRKFVKE